MGTRKKFSAAEKELLRANPYTEKVTENQISFTLAFKGSLLAAECRGCTEHGAAGKLGYDRSCSAFGASTTSQSASAARKITEGIQPAPKSRMRISREQFGAAELEKMSRRESERPDAGNRVSSAADGVLKLMRQPEERIRIPEYGR